VNEIEYQKLAAVEDTMWWFRGLRKNVFALIDRFVSHRAAPMLDAGCGTGGILRALAQTYPRSALYGIDIFRGAVSHAAITGAHVSVASVNALPFRSDFFGCIFSLDVICQRGVDVARTLQEFHRCLMPLGVLVVQVPAYMWLWGYHDVQCHTQHRFTRHELAMLLDKHGFKISFMTYWNSILLPLLAIRRKLLPVTYVETDVKKYPMLLDRIFGAAVSLECKLIHRGFALPFGSSVLIAGVKRV